jgi:hypothetical protein
VLRRQTAREFPDTSRQESLQRVRERVAGIGRWVHGGWHKRGMCAGTKPTVWTAWSISSGSADCARPACSTGRSSSVRKPGSSARRPPQRAGKPRCDTGRRRLWSQPSSAFTWIRPDGEIRRDRDAVSGARVRARQRAAAEGAVDGQSGRRHQLHLGVELPVPEQAHVVVACCVVRSGWRAASRGRCPCRPASSAGPARRAARDCALGPEPCTAPAPTGRLP